MWLTPRVSPLPSAVIMVAHFLQSLTHRLVLGGELVYHRRPGEEGAILTLAGKYSGTGRSTVGKGRGVSGLCLCPPLTPMSPCAWVFLTALHWVATLNVGSGGAHASYYHKANEQVRLRLSPSRPSKSVMNLCPLWTTLGPAALGFVQPILRACLPQLPRSL